MSRNQPFATRLPPDLVRTLDDVCERFGLRKNFVIEQAVREKLEDILDTFELEAAQKSAVSFVPWEQVESELRRQGKL